MRRLLLALVGLLLSLPALAAPARERPTLETRLRALLADDKAIGALIVDVDGDAPPLRITHGMAHRDGRKPVTEQTLFRIGSVSKHLTSLLAVRMAATGDISLDAPISTR